MALEFPDPHLENGYTEVTLMTQGYQYLKVVKIIGFSGFSPNCDFLMQIIKNAIALEKIIIDTRIGHKMGGNRSKIDVARRTRAEQLKSLVYLQT